MDGMSNILVRVSAGGRAIGATGYAAFLVFAATLFWGPAGPYLSLIPLLIWFVHWARQSDSVAPRSPLVWLAWVFSLYVAVSVLLGYLADPSTREWQAKVLSDYLRIAGVWPVLIAPWLMGERSRRNRNLLFGLALFGFMCESITSIPWSSLGHTDGRWGLVAGPNSSAVISGVFFLLVILVGGSWLFRAIACRHRVALVVGLPIWVALVAVLAVYIVFMQSRSAWLALVVVMAVVALVASWRTARLGSVLQRRCLCGLMAGVAAIAAIAAITQSHLIERRIEAAQEPIVKIATLSTAEMESGSLSRRVWMYEFGLAKALERPVFGWSAGGVKSLLNEQAPQRISDANQIHNMHLEILLGLGVVGFGLFYAMVAISLVEVARAMRAGRLPLEWGGFWLSASVFVGIEALFDTRFFVYEYGAVLMLLAALAIACQLDRLGRRPALARPDHGCTL